MNKIVIKSLNYQAYTNCQHWVQSFALVRRIVGGVDYKGVCDNIY